MSNHHQHMGMPKINFASSMIVEDHLKKVLAKTDGKGWKFSMNKLLPRSQHSPFGDFPSEYFPAKGSGIEPVPRIDAAEVSIAAKGTRKYSSLARVILQFFKDQDARCGCSSASSLVIMPVEEVHWKTRRSLIERKLEVKAIQKMVQNKKDVV